MNSVAGPGDAPALSIHRLRSYYEKHEERLAIAFFVGGFVFDVIMADRVDSWVFIGQQTLYLGLVLAGLMQMFFEQISPPDLVALGRLKKWYFQYRPAAINFLLGTLLNLYTIFYFKSSSLLVSFAFLVFLIFVLVANESARFKVLGLPFKFALLSLCFLSYAANIVPIFVGTLGTSVFLFSLTIGCLPLVSVSWWIQQYAATYFDRAKSQILLPLGGVLGGFLLLYFLKLIPPVPLSLPYIGVFHGVEREANVYKLSHERPWWRFWQKGDQYFIAQRNDLVYVAFRVFSPTRFAGEVLVKWYWRDHHKGWLLQDSKAINITGGREQGFRGYATKAHYQPGEWKVQIETTDNREIGRVYFELEIGPDQPRTFQQDIL